MQPAFYSQVLCLHTYSSDVTISTAYFRRLLCRGSLILVGNCGLASSSHRPRGPVNLAMFAFAAATRAQMCIVCR